MDGRKRKPSPARKKIRARARVTPKIRKARGQQALKATREKENALKEQQEQFRFIFNHVNDAIFSLDLNGTILWANSPTQGLTGRLMTELVGSPVMSVLTPESEVVAEARLAANRMGKEVPPLVEFGILRPDGKVIVAEANIAGVQEAEGAVSRLLVLRDITERKQASVLLRESENRFKAQYQGIPVPTFTWRKTEGDFVLLDCNKAAEVFTRGQIATLLGKTARELYADEPAILEDFSRCLEERTTIRRELSYRLRSTNVTKDMIVDYVFVPPDMVMVHAVDITERKLAEEEREKLYERLQASHDGLRTLSRRLLQVQETERRHLARELHDEIGQALTATKINIQQALNEPSSSAIETHLAESVRILDYTLQQVRSLALDLRPSLLDDLGLVPTLKWLAERHSQTSEITVHLSAGPLTVHLEPAIELACYRIAQEALTNAARHAGATKVSIELACAGQELVLSIRDNGIGFDVTAMLSQAVAGDSIGLLGMQERATLTGGEIDLSSSPGQGTTIRARFPLAQPVDTTL